MTESDIEMLSGDGEERATSGFDNPPQSPSVSATSSRHTPHPENNSNAIQIGDDNEIQPVLTVGDGDDDDDNNNNDNNNDKLPATVASGQKPASKPSSKPPSSKPRSSKPHKARSPSPTPPPPPPPAPPLQTIRLEIKLGGPNNYAVDIAEVSRSTGQRPPTPTQPGVGHVSDSEDDDDDEKGKEKGKGKSKKKVSQHLSPPPTQFSLSSRRTIRPNTTTSLTPSSTTRSLLLMSAPSLRRRSSRGFTYRVGRSLCSRTRRRRNPSPRIHY